MRRDVLEGSARTERAHVRVPIDAFARTIDGDREYAFRTRDVSEGGLFLVTRVGHLYPFAVGAELELELHHDALTFAVRGIVVRVSAAAEEHQGFGVRLVPSERQRELLRRLMSSFAAAPHRPA